MSQIIIPNEREIQDVERKIRGKFNKDLLLNSFFEHTELFSPAATNFLKTGKYSGEIFNSKKYNIFWERERERCLEGFENPITKVWIPGKYYFFLNYKQMKIIPEDQKHLKKAKRITAFPKFWPIHYHFSLDYKLSIENGLNMAVLKPRDTGFSELLSSFGVHEYTFQTEDPVFFFTGVERYLIKDGILSKAWDQLEFLNENTERAFKHLRQKIDQSFIKRASYIDPETRTERKTGGEIHGAVVDHPRKLRGARGFVNFEEGGSFPDVESAWMTAKALAEQGGVKFAHMLIWGTGGEQGDGIAGLDNIFNKPDAFECLEFDNCWMEGAMYQPHGFFFPVWANMTKFMDKWGNTDHQKAKAFWDEQREKTRAAGSNMLLDKLIAEFPYTPMEALMRLQNNPFPVEKLTRQLMLVESDPNIRGMLKVGKLEVEDKVVKFKLDNTLDPVNKYPHKNNEVLEGAFTMLEAPLRDESGRVPANLYYVVVDCFAVDTDQATEFDSLGTIYVYKKRNNVFPTEDDILVAWYAGRPPRVQDFHTRVFLAARFYNALVQSEIKGGGQELLNFAKNKGFLEYCGERPTIFNQDKDQKRVSGRQYFVRIEDWNKGDLLIKLADWLLKERALKIEGDKTEYTLNLERIYDRGLLEELIKFYTDGNFDRISALLVLMTTMQEAELQEIIAVNTKNRDHIFNRPLYTNGINRSSSTLSLNEMIRVDGRNNDLIM